MKKQIKFFLLFSSVFAMVYWSSCTPDDVEPPTPVEPTPCTVLYPPIDATVDTSIFYFQWCAIDGATKYRIQADIDVNVEEPIYDIIVDSLAAKSTIFRQVINNPNNFVESSPFSWGNTYQWRIAPIINGVQRGWSEVYTFKTWDARDKYIGTYTTNKYIGKYDLFDNFYLADNLGVAQVKVEKVANSTKKIRITEIGGNNLTEVLESQGLDFEWSKIHDVYPNLATFMEQSDSLHFVFMTNPVDSIPWGYHFGGHF
jgi:hypothetical protein